MSLPDPGGTAQWSTLAGQSLSHHSWDGESVVFNDLSGDTHLLDADALALLMVLQEGPHSVADLARRLAPDDEDAVAVLTGMLDQLAAIGLAAPLAP